MTQANTDRFQSPYTAKLLATVPFGAPNSAVKSHANKRMKKGLTATQPAPAVPDLARAASAAAAHPLASELRPGQSLELLKALHILTRDGQLNQDSRRKLKQVQHLLQFIEKLLLELAQAPAPEPKLSSDQAGAWPPGLTLADHGAGKSYLGFMLYDLFFRQRSQGHIYGIESRPELVQKSVDLAARLGFTRMSFINLTVAESAQSACLPDRMDVVTALHACDTATDDAIAFGLQKHARAMVLVPCCQAEVARVLSQHKALSLARTPLSELWRHPLHTREMGSQITNVLRCLYLEACGYQVTVTELVGWEHSLKNELIMARYTGQNKRASAERLRALVAEFGLQSLLKTRFTCLPDNAKCGF